MTINDTEKYIVCKNTPVTMAVIFITITVGLLVACRPAPKWQADISGIHVAPVQVKRYEKVLFNIDPGNLRAEIDPYIADFKLFLGTELDNPVILKQLYGYITDPFIREIYYDVEKAWPDLYELENQLTEAFHYYKYHFPQNSIPVVYSYVSGIDYHSPVKFHENNLIIGLDMFMGTGYEKYDRVGIPVFIRQRFLAENAPLEAMLVLGQGILKHNTNSPETLLDFMIYEGKLLYFLDCMFPRTSDSLKIAYTTRQIRWAERYQAQAWAHLIENELLYTTDKRTIRGFIGEAPFTDAFSSTSAPRMGSFIGWQIVRSFMRRNPDVTLHQLMTAKAATEILEGANYRP